MIFQHGGIEPITTACAVGACSAAAPIASSLVAPFLATIGIGSAGVVLHNNRGKTKNKKITKKSIKKGSKKSKKKSEKKRGGGKSKKKSKSKSQKGGKFRKGELVLLKMDDGTSKNMIFVRTENRKTVLRYPNRKGPGSTITVNSNKVKRIPKSIVNSKKRQKNKRKQLVRRKRGLKTTTTTEELSDGPTYAPGSPPSASSSLARRASYSPQRLPIPQRPPTQRRQSEEEIDDLFSGMEL